MSIRSFVAEAARASCLLMKQFTSINPSTGKVLATYSSFDADQLESAVQAAVNEQLRWKASTLEERAQLLTDLARALERDQREYAAEMSREMGKPFREALAEVKKCATTLRYAAEHGPAVIADQVVATEARQSLVVRRPLGVILAVMPWNFPFWQLFRFAGPALLAGNTILMKHAEATMGCATLIERIFRKAGAPRGLLQNLPIEHEQVASLLKDPRIKGLTLTGSTQAGRTLAAQAGAALKPCVLELGGNDPFIVMQSADLEVVLPEALRARLQNNGQSCIAAKRFFIHESLHDTFIQRLKTAMAQLRIGDPMDETVDIGPLVSENARDTLHRQVEKALSEGATLETGGQALAGPGFFYPPTLISGLKADSDMHQEELFGPVALVWCVSSIEEAVSLANRSPFGLSASLWTQDPQEEAHLRTHLESGSIFINAMSRSDARLPFGGVKQSGFGRELGQEGFLAFTNCQTVWVA